MDTPYESLLEFVASSGVPQSIAEFAARRCALAMAAKGAAFHSRAEAIASFMEMKPGGARRLADPIVTPAPPPSEVQAAIRYWASVNFEARQ